MPQCLLVHQWSVLPNPLENIAFFVCIQERGLSIGESMLVLLIWRLGRVRLPSCLAVLVRPEAYIRVVIPLFPLRH